MNTCQNVFTKLGFICMYSCTFSSKANNFNIRFDAENGCLYTGLRPQDKPSSGLSSASVVCCSSAASAFVSSVSTAPDGDSGSEQGGQKLELGHT